MLIGRKLHPQILAKAKLSETFWKHMSPIMYKHKISVHVMKHLFLHARVMRSHHATLLDKDDSKKRNRLAKEFKHSYKIFWQNTQSSYA